MYISPDEFPLPWEYRNWTFDRLVGAPPDDVDERTIVFLDCGNIDRMPVDFLQREGLHILNIDHHHDNTRFGTVNFVVPEASCTAEIVWELAQGAGRRAHAGDRRGALHGAGHGHRPVHVREHRRRGAPHGGRADHRRGASRTRCTKRLYEDLPFSRLELLQRALATVERHDHGPMTRRAPGQGGLRGDRRARDRLGGRGRPPARRRRARAWPCWCASCSGDDRGGMRKVSLRATDEQRRRVADRARVRRRRPHAGRRLHHGHALSRADRGAAQRRCAEQLASESRPPIATGSCCSPSRPV